MKKTKESASEMNIHHKILLDTIPDIVYFKDAQGRNLVVNKAFEELVGLKKEEIAGKTDEQLFPPELAECCSRSDGEVFRSGRTRRFEEDCVGKDGKRIFFDTVKSPVCDENRNIIGLVGVSRNITEYRQTLEDLQLFKSIINQTNDGVVIVDPETSRFIYVNDKYCSNLGYTRKEMFNMKVIDIEAILPDNFSWKGHVEEVKKQGYMILEGIHKRKDGTTFPVWVNVKYLNIIENNYMVGIVRDITEWKKIQDEMQRINQGLEQRVIERTAQLEATNRQLKEEIIEHKKDEKRLTLKYAITYILSESDDLKETLTKTLKVICEYNEWGIGEIWFIDKVTNTLRLGSIWHNPSWHIKEFETVSREIGFQKGRGLPGRVWETGQPSWIADVIDDKNFLRESIASKLGLHGAFAFPIKISGSVVGVMSFFSHTIEPPDNDFLQMFDSIGSQIGGFMARKQAEEALRVSEAKLKTLFEILPVGISVLGVERQIIYMNPALERILDMSREAILRGDYKKRMYLRPDGTPRPNEEYASVRAVKEQRAIYNVETGVVKEDGNVIWTSVDAIPVKFADWKVIVVTSDITERKKMEVETQKIKTLNAIGILAGGIAHDFNNLLTAILGNIYLTKMYLSKKNISSDDEIFKRLKDSEESCMHAKDLTGMLITFAKGGGPIKEPIEISKLLKETTTLLIPSNLPITCEFDIPDNLYPVKADKLQIKQVIRGIVTNAVEAMPNGGVIKVWTENITVGENANLSLKGGKYLKVSIQDNGVGIPEENLSKIFDPYFSTKERGSQKGMGLGLSICYSIINRHEGLITVDSKVGVGTTFHFYLPANLE